MTKWEYETWPIGTTPGLLVVEFLNQQGALGWELCGMWGGTYVFKRPLP